MSLLTDFFPIAVFFIVFKLKGVMYATMAAIIASFIQLIIIKLRTNKIQNTQLISFVSLLVLGGFALICKKEIFIKWKPTVIYWALAIILLVSKYVKKTSLLKKLGNNAIALPEKIWNKLDFIWVIFFIFMGCLNLYIVYYFDTNTWVNFKLFGTLLLTVIFIICQTIFLSKYLRT
jgi:intracellular septation protein